MAFFILTINAFAQKIEFDKKTRIATLENEFVCKIIKKKTSVYTLKILDKNDEEQIKVILRSYKDPMEISKSNPEGTVRYAEYIFINSGERAESSKSFWKAKKMAKFIHKSELFKDGMLNDEAVKDFVLENGMEYSKNRRY